VWNLAHYGASLGLKMELFCRYFCLCRYKGVSPVSSHISGHGGKKKSAVAPLPHRTGATAPDSWQGDDGHTVDVKTGLAYRGPPKNAPNLMASIKRGDVTVVEQLLQSGFDVNTVGMWGNTALLTACQYRKEKIAMLLLSLDKGKSVDVNVVNDRGYTPLLLATLEGMADVTESLLAHGATCTRPEARIYNHIFDVNMYLTPLSAAIVNGHVKIVENLLQHGYDANERYSPEYHVNDKGRFGETPLLLALARRSDIGIIKALLRHGADVHDENSEGKSASDLTEEIAVNQPSEESEIVHVIQEWVKLTNKFEDGAIRLASAVSH